MDCVVRKPAFFCICENKDADQLRGKLISAFVFTTQIVQSLYFRNTKFQASSHLLWLYSPIGVGPGRKPRRPVFSQRGSYRASSSFPGLGDTNNKHLREPHGKFMKTIKIISLQSIMKTNK